MIHGGCLSPRRALRWYSRKMILAPSDRYLFVHHGFDDTFTPQLTLLRNETFISLPLHGQRMTLTFDMQRRYCTGWHDLASRQNFACPEATETLKGFDQCRHCQLKTGFNPAFYHAKSIS